MRGDANFSNVEIFFKCFLAAELVSGTKTPFLEFGIEGHWESLEFPIT